MKLVIIAALLSFVVAAGVIMFLTGTFKRAPEQSAELVAEADAVDDAVTDAEADNTGNNDVQIVGQPSATQTGETLAASEAKLRAQLAKYEAQIVEADSKLIAIKAEIESLNSVKTAISRNRQLAKVYGSMKPDTAALVLCQLDEDFTNQILYEMDVKIAGKIMDAIATADPSYCARVSKRMGDAEHSQS